MHIYLKNYDQVRNALVYCLKWIESKQAEEEKIKYGIILGEVSHGLFLNKK